MGGKTIAFTSKSVKYSRMRARARACVYARHSCLHRSRDAGLVQRSRQS